MVVKRKLGLVSNSMNCGEGASSPVLIPSHGLNAVRAILEQDP